LRLYRTKRIKRKSNSGKRQRVGQTRGWRSLNPTRKGALAKGGRINNFFRESLEPGVTLVPIQGKRVSAIVILRFGGKGT